MANVLYFSTLGFAMKPQFYHSPVTCFVMDECISLTRVTVSLIRRGGEGKTTLSLSMKWHALAPIYYMLSPPYITCIQSPDRSRELGCAAACRDAVEANAVPWSLGHCSIQSHQDPGEEIHNPTRAERRECGGGMGRRGSSDRVPVSVFPFPCVLGISNNISRQIIKCIEVCIFFLHRVGAAFWKVLFLIINTNRTSLKRMTLLCGVYIFPPTLRHWWQKSLVFKWKGRRLLKIKITILCCIRGDEFVDLSLLSLIVYLASQVHRLLKPWSLWEVMLFTAFPRHCYFVTFLAVSDVSPRNGIFWKLWFGVILWKWRECLLWPQWHKIVDVAPWHLMQWITLVG